MDISHSFSKFKYPIERWVWYNKMEYLMIIGRVIRFVKLIPCLMVLSTVFVVIRELEHGVVSGKYFWFYMAMGAMAIWSISSVVRNANSIRPIRICLLCSNIQVSYEFFLGYNAFYIVICHAGSESASNCYSKTRQSGCVRNSFLLSLLRR